MENDMAAYLAGLYDGEGSYVIRNNGQEAIQLGVSDEVGFEWLCNLFTTEKIIFSRWSWSPKGKIEYKKMYGLAIYQKSSRIAFLKMIRPYSKIFWSKVPKKAQYEVL